LREKNNYKITLTDIRLSNVGKSPLNVLDLDKVFFIIY
jgi:hypothetical protein